jgi:hypothetical protein
MKILRFLVIAITKNRYENTERYCLRNECSERNEKKNVRAGGVRRKAISTVTQHDLPNARIDIDPYELLLPALIYYSNIM